MHRRKFVAGVLAFPSISGCSKLIEDPLEVWANNFYENPVQLDVSVVSESDQSVLFEDSYRVAGSNTETLFDGLEIQNRSQYKLVCELDGEIRKERPIKDETDEMVLFISSEKELTISVVAS